MTATVARCVVRGHQDDDGPAMAARMAAYDLMLQATPGDHDDDIRPETTP
jgi:hypothetical protein